MNLTQMIEEGLVIEEKLGLVLEELAATTRENLAIHGLGDATTLILDMIGQLGMVADSQKAIRGLAGRDPTAAVATAKRLATETILLADLCVRLVVLEAICTGKKPRKEG